MRIGTRRRVGIGVVAVAMAMVAVACGSSKSTSAGSTDGTSGAGGDINLVAYSTPQAAYEGIEAAFNKTPAGKGVSAVMRANTRRRSSSGTREMRCHRLSVSRTRACARIVSSAPAASAA